MTLEACPNCNVMISPDAATCPKCGQPLTAERWEMARVKRRRSGTRMAKIVGVLGIAFIGLAVLATALAPHEKATTSAVVASQPAVSLDAPFMSSGDATVCNDLNDAIVSYKLWEAADIDALRARVGQDSCWLIEKGTQLTAIGLSDIDQNFALVSFTDEVRTYQAWVKLAYVL